MDFGESVVNLNQGLMPLALGRSRINISGLVVFAGYGTSAPRLDCDDYAEVDADSASDTDNKFPGTQNIFHALFATSIENAIEHGQRLWCLSMIRRASTKWSRMSYNELIKRIPATRSSRSN